MRVRKCVRVCVCVCVCVCMCVRVCVCVCVCVCVWVLVVCAWVCLCTRMPHGERVDAVQAVIASHTVGGFSTHWGDVLPLQGCCQEAQPVRRACVFHTLPGAARGAAVAPLLARAAGCAGVYGLELVQPGHALGLSFRIRGMLGAG